VWRVRRESPGEVFRRATSPEDDVNGGGQWRKRRGEGELGGERRSEGPKDWCVL
jgi:hypothetical protein